MKIQHLSHDEALASLNSRLDGLSQDEARRRIDEYGPNLVAQLRSESLLRAFARQFTHFFALILWMAAGLAFFADWHAPAQGMSTLGYAILGVILINGLFSFWQEYRAEKAIDALRHLLPQKTRVRRNATVFELPACDLVPGDIVLLEEGDNVPADCRVIEAVALRVNNATVTGESLPKGRDAHPADSEDLHSSRNILLAGTSIVAGHAAAVIFATGMHTEFGRIAHLAQRSTDTISPLQREIVRVSRLLALLATLLGVAFFFTGRAMGLTFWESLLFGIGIIVANVPEGLLPTVTLALAMATQRMAKQKALIRHLPAVEALGAATVICTDKTGTLTQNSMRVARVWHGGLVKGAAEIADPVRLALRHRQLLLDAALCHNLKPKHDGWLGDPMERALAEWAESGLGGVPNAPRIDELPFDTDRKRMSTIHASEEGWVLYCKGAPEIVLPRCREIETEEGIVALDATLRGEAEAAVMALSEQGLRVLAFAWRKLPARNSRDPESSMVLAGLIGLEDPPRPEVHEAVSKCRTAGIKVIMVTGDHPHTAVAVARQVGLVAGESPRVITGETLKHLSGAQLQLALDAKEVLFARVGADQKMRIVEALQRKKHVVAVTGDGVNDAPALKAADIGIAMGIAGTDVAKESADMVLLDDNFASIVLAIEEGRAVYDNIRKFLAYILTSNIPEVVPYLAFALFRIPLPLTVVQILAVDLGTDMVPALGLGMEPPARNVMLRPPRPRQERLMSNGLLMRAYLFLGMLEAIASMSAFFFVLSAGGWKMGDDLPSESTLYLQATTAALTAIVVMQVVNVFLCRNPESSIFNRGVFANRLILSGIVLELGLILMIDYTPWGQNIFGTAGLPLDVWLFILPFALGMLLLDELRKILVSYAMPRHNFTLGK